MALILKGRAKLKGSTVIGKRPYAIDIVGVIYKATGVMLTDPEGNDYPETAPLDGYHLNVRLLNDIMREAVEAIDATHGVTPNSPSRVWA